MNNNIIKTYFVIKNICLDKYITGKNQVGYAINYTSQFQNTSPFSGIPVKKVFQACLNCTALILM